MRETRLVFGALVLLGVLALSASAQVQRTFVSGQGNDNNPCSLAAPCRTFSTAIGAVGSGGEVIVLNSAGYGAFPINKAVTVTVPPGVYAGISVFSGDGIAINAGSTDVVILRGLGINQFGGTNGINFTSGKALHVENCTINGFAAGAGILETGSGDLFVKDTIIRNNQTGIDVAPATGTARASIDQTRLEGNQDGVAVGQGGKVSVRNSVASGSSDAGFLATCAAGACELNIDSCLVANNVTGVSANGTSGGIGTVRISDSEVTDNGTGLLQQGAGVLLSSGSNSVEGNTTANTTGTIGSYTVR
jgi:hypothetical protein